jgi:transglutaminase-like putative cysteine protease
MKEGFQMQFVMKQRSFDDYLRSTDVINHIDPKVQFVAQYLMGKMMQKISDEPEAMYADPEIELTRITYEFVRDRISHSSDIISSRVTWKASDVLLYKEGTCYAKAHLLAALLRANGIPTGLCYQYLRKDGTEQTPLILHGLNAVYFESLGTWIRLDARGNKNGVNAQFLLDEERLAFPVDPGMGELDVPSIFADTDRTVLAALQKHDSLADLMDHLPMSLHG